MLYGEYSESALMLSQQLFLTDFIVCEYKTTKSMTQCHCAYCIAMRSKLTSQTLRECRASAGAQSLLDFQRGPRAAMFSGVLPRRVGRTGGQRYRLEKQDKDANQHTNSTGSGRRTPATLSPTPRPAQSIPAAGKADAPIGSSRVQNHTTCVGLGMLGRQRSTERMARSPCVRGWATP